MTSRQKYVAVVDRHGQTRHVTLQRFGGGYAARVDDELVNEGEVYTTKRDAISAVEIAYDMRINDWLNL